MNSRHQLFAILVGGLLMASCSNAEDSPTAESTSSSTAVAPELPQPTEPLSNAGGIGASDFVELSDQFLESSFTATYRIENADPDSGTPVRAEWTWYQDGPMRSRLDLSFAGGAGSVISTPERNLVCTGGTCLVSAPGGGIEIPDLRELLFGSLDALKLAGALGTVGESAGRSIAGMEARCFSIENADQLIAGTFCFTDEGFLLLAETETDDGEFRMEAVSFEGAVDDADFEPPYPVISPN